MTNPTPRAEQAVCRNCKRREDQHVKGVSGLLGCWNNSASTTFEPSPAPQAHHVPFSASDACWWCGHLSGVHGAGMEPACLWETCLCEGFRNAPQAPEPPLVPSPIWEVQQPPKPLTGEELWGQPEKQESGIARCLCCVCVFRRDGFIGELSKEEQFDFDAWHKKPMIGWFYRQLGYMARAKVAESDLARAQAAIAELVKALTRSDSYLSLLRHRAERDISWNDLGLRVSEVDEVIGQSRTALARAKEHSRG